MLGRRLNGEMVLLARKRRRKTQIELAEETGIPQAAISRIENGTREELSSDDVQRVAKALRFPPAFFYEQDLVYRKPLSLHTAAFRKKASVPVKDTDAIVALGNHYVLQLRRLLDSVELQSEYELLQFEIVSQKDGAGEHARAIASASDAAAAVRAAWQVGDGPLHSLTRYVEATGVIVIKADFGGADIDGFTLRPVGLRPVIFLNKARTPDRMRFSLAHEFAHAVLHPFPYEGMESEANEFAAALLMPRESILPDLRRGLTIPAIGRLKLKWQVSMASIIYRAKALGVIDGDSQVQLYMKMAPYRAREPAEFDIPPEETKLIGDLIRIHSEELGYPINELATATMTLPEEFAEMHGLLHVQTRVERPKLRLVASSGDKQKER